jgi:hypothetical protein
MTEPEQPSSAATPDPQAPAAPDAAPEAAPEAAIEAAPSLPATESAPPSGPPAAAEAPLPAPDAAPSAWPAAAPVAVSAPPSWPATGDTPSWPATAAPAAVAPTTSSNAIISLILAIVSWVVCPIAPAIVALVFASMAAKEIDAAGGRLEGRGLVTASRIVSWINIGFWAAVILVGLFVLLIVLIASGTNSLRN